MQVIKIRYGDIQRQTDLANNRVSSALVDECEINTEGVVRNMQYRGVGLAWFRMVVWKL